MYARTTVGPKRSRLRTAERLARKQGIISIYPLQSHTLERVAASFMHAGYRTTPKYLTELKVRNTELGFEWSAQLDLTMHRCCAATQRGIGPPRKAGEIHLAVAAKMCEGQTPLVRGGPEFAKRSWLISVFWLLREIELANVKLHSSHVVIGGAWARLVLPASKNDPGAVGRARTFLYICALQAVSIEGVPGALVCPVCALKRQVSHMCGKHCITQDDARALSVPLFTTSVGGAVRKDAIVASWRALYSAAAAPAERQHANLITGHSARRSGAKTLCRCGWALWKIQFHARWDSDAVKGYTEEAFAESADLWRIAPASEQQRDGGTEAGRSQQLSDVFDRIEEVRNHGLQLEQAVARTAAELEITSNELACIVERVASELDGRTRYIRNTGGDRLVHILTDGHLEAPISQWRSRCGWAPANKNKFALRFAAPAEVNMRCKHCFGQVVANVAPSGA